MSFKCLAFCILICLSSNSFGQDSLPSRNGMVNDFEFLLTDSQKTVLTNLAESYKKDSGDELIIVTLKSIEPYTDMNEFSLALLNKWNPGTDGKHNGMLIILSATMGSLKIENGKNIERRMSNARTKYIMDYYMMPYLMNAQFYGALKAGLSQVGDYLKRHP